MGIAADLTIVVVAGVIGAVAARLARQPLILGYLLAGVLLGPRLSNVVTDVANLELLAEIGVTLLLFGLGLELSFRELAPVRRVALLGTPIQVTLSALVGAGFGRLLGFDWLAAIWLGALLSLSSTIVVIKTLQAQGRMGTLSSRVMLGMLVVQDVAVIPMMIVLPRLSSLDAGLAALALSIAKATAFLALMVVIGGRVFPWIVERVARSGSRELFLLVVTGLALGVGYLTHFAGLSAALGAFVAGLVLSESEYSHQALADIIPLRDVFSLVFFASVGMLLDPAQLLAQAPTVAATVLVVGACKGLVFAGVTRGFGYHNVIPLAAGLGLFQVGEFSFVLARAGLSSGAISPDLYALVLNTAITTMALTPAVSGLTAPLYRRFAPRRGHEPLQALNLPRVGLRDHVIIAGAGRVGRHVAETLAEHALPFVIVELDSRRLDQAKARGWPIVFGDASQLPVIHAAGLDHARLVLVTVPAFTVARGIVDRVRQANPAVPVVARADGFDALDELRELGVEEAIQPELEAGLEMTRQALVHLGLPSQDILRLTDQMRRERYGKATRTAAGDAALVARLAGAMRLLEFEWIEVQPGSELAGRSIGEAHVRSRTGASIVGVARGERFTASPGPDTPLEAGALLAVVGRRESLVAVEGLAAPAASREPAVTRG